MKMGLLRIIYALYIFYFLNHPNAHVGIGTLQVCLDPKGKNGEGP